MGKTSSSNLVPSEEFAREWDTERRTQQIDPITFRLRGSTMYVPTRTKIDMDAAFGGPVQAVRTRTFADDFRVWISPCKTDTRDARRLRLDKATQSTATFGFAIPLRKLGLKVPFSRQYYFNANRLEVDGGGVIYEISFREFENLPRDLNADALALAKAAKAEKRQAQRKLTAGNSQAGGAAPESTPSPASGE